MIDLTTYFQNKSGASPLGKEAEGRASLQAQLRTVDFYAYWKDKVRGVISPILEEPGSWESLPDQARRILQSTQDFPASARVDAFSSIRIEDFIYARIEDLICSRFWRFRCPPMMDCAWLALSEEDAPILAAVQIAEAARYLPEERIKHLYQRIYKDSINFIVKKLDRHSDYPWPELEVKTLLTFEALTLFPPYVEPSQLYEDAKKIARHPGHTLGVHERLTLFLHAAKTTFGPSRWGLCASDFEDLIVDLYRARFIKEEKILHWLNRGLGRLWQPINLKSVFEKISGPDLQILEDSKIWLHERKMREAALRIYRLANILEMTNFSNDRIEVGLPVGPKERRHLPVAFLRVSSSRGGKLIAADSRVRFASEIEDAAYRRFLEETKALPVISEPAAI